jgi:hypothetical protein
MKDATTGLCGTPSSPGLLCATWAIVGRAARHEHRMIHAGHNLPQEAPAAFADAALTVRKWLPADDGT